MKAQLHTPRGDVDGVLLEDGTIVRLPPPEAQKLAALLADGQTPVRARLRLRGGARPLIAAKEIGADKDHLQPVAGPRGFGPGGHFRGHGMWHGGPGHMGERGPGPDGDMGAPPPPPPPQ